jgi:hypothetical protein
VVQITREELVQQLRNQGKGGQTKTSRFRGVMKHAKGKWEARLGQVCGSKYQYLGLFGTEIEAAVAYDRALIAQQGLDSATNFNFDNYEDILGAPVAVLTLATIISSQSFALCCLQLLPWSSSVTPVSVEHAGQFRGTRGSSHVHRG